MRRFVPKTYHNRRFLRIIFRIVVFFTLSVLILFIALFFLLKPYFVTHEDGTQKLEIPWLMDETPPQD